METLVEALDALGDGIAIYDNNANPLFTNEVTRRRFARMYADMDAGMTYRQAIEATVKRLMPDATPAEVDRLDIDEPGAGIDLGRGEPSEC